MTEVAKEYPEMELSHMYVDNTIMQLTREPKAADVIEKAVTMVLDEG